MKLNKDAMKEVMNYVIEEQTFDFDNGRMSPVFLTDITNDLCHNDESKRQELACAIYRCIFEGLMSSDYPRAMWGVASIEDVTLRGFEWLEKN